jgi:hypothetical protein
MPRVTAEELEDENIMKNDTDIKLWTGSKESSLIVIDGILWESNNVIYGCLNTGEIKVIVGQTWCKQRWINDKCNIMRIIWGQNSVLSFTLPPQQCGPNSNKYFH